MHSKFTRALPDIEPASSSAVEKTSLMESYCQQLLCCQKAT